MRTFLCTATVALAACTLLTPLDDFASSSAVGDAGTREPDGSVPTDGGIDADADAAPAFSCATSVSDTTTVCTDFGGARLDEGWSKIELLADVGYLGPSTTELLSPPQGLEVRITRDIGSAIVRLQKDIGPTPRRARLAFSIKIAPRTLAAEKNFISIAEFLCGRTGAYNGVWLHFRPGIGGRPELKLVANSNALPLTTPFPVGVWTRVVLDVTWSADGVAYAVTYNGAPAGSGDLTTPPCAGRSDVRAVLGLSGDVATTAFYDDAVLDVE